MPQLASQQSIQRLLILAARNLTAVTDYDEFLVTTQKLGIEGEDQGDIAKLLYRTGRGEEKAAWELLRYWRELGSNQLSVDQMIGLAQLLVLAYLDHEQRNKLADDQCIPDQDRPPKICMKIEPDGFLDLDRGQRSDICRLLSTLACSVDVQLCVTTLTEAYLRNQHKHELPCVSDWENSPINDEHVATALTELDPDSLPVTILNTLRDEPTETLSYSQLYSTTPRSKSRVRQCIATLKEYNAVEKTGSHSNRLISLTATGTKILSTIHKTKGTQSNLDRFDQSEASVSDPPKSQSEGRVPGAQARDRMEDKRGERCCYRTSYLKKWQHDGIAACALAGDVSFIDGETRHTDGKTRGVSVDQQRNEVLVSLKASTPLTYTTSLAVALASPQLINQCLDPATLETIFDEFPPEVLQWGRQIGYLSEDSFDKPEKFRDSLVSIGESIEDMTTALKHGDYDRYEGVEDSANLVTKILRESHGLAGTIAHLLDLAGYDLIRDIRLHSTLSLDQQEQLATSIAHSLVVQSNYRHRAGHRQLFEDRPKKRKLSLDVNVDADDPYGHVLGSTVIRGQIGQLPDLIDDALREDPHEDAPEFQIPVSITDGDELREDRTAFALAAGRVLSSKDISLTWESVSVLHAVVSDPVETAAALNHLASEETTERREIRPDEVRYAVSRLPASSLLPELPGTISDIICSLLGATESLTQRELADQAGVTQQTIRNHRDSLADIGLIENTDNGWRLRLAFDQSEDRYPHLDDSQSCLNCANQCGQPGQKNHAGQTQHQHGRSDLSAIPPPTRIRPAQSRGSVNHSWGSDQGRSCLDPWMQLLRQLYPRRCRRGDVPEQAEKTAKTINVGPSISQTPIV